jgi:hypothetical protein
MAIIAIALDEFVVDNRARIAAATRPDGKIDWNVMSSPDLILSLDQPWPTQLTRLKEIAQEYEIWYVTSRQATRCHPTLVQWLAREGYPYPQNVICRSQFQKTIVSKAEAIFLTFSTQQLLDDQFHKTVVGKAEAVSKLYERDYVILLAKHSAADSEGLDIANLANVPLNPTLSLAV